MTRSVDMFFGVNGQLRHGLADLPCNTRDVRCSLAFRVTAFTEESSGSGRALAQPRLAPRTGVAVAVRDEGDLAVEPLWNGGDQIVVCVTDAHGEPLGRIAGPWERRELSRRMQR